MTECSPEEYARASTDPASITCLNRGQSIGVSITAEAGLLSLLAILCIFLIIAYNVWWRRRHLPNATLQIFHQPMDILMASLLFGDVLQAIGMVMSLRWVRIGKVVTGSFCDAQGIIKMLGASGVALSTLLIAIYTFLGVWVMRDIRSMKLTLGLVMGMWSFIAFLIVVGVSVNRHKDVSFIGPTPYWCWVNKYHFGLGWKMALEYLWMWLTLAFSILIYVPLYLWMRGNIVISGTSWWKFHYESSPNLDAQARAFRRQSLIMLAYPVVYCICILPLSGVRWTSFVQGSNIAPAATFTVVSIFGLSGFFNVILLLKTRPSSGLFGHLMYLQPARPPSIHEVNVEPLVIQPVEPVLGRLPP